MFNKIKTRMASEQGFTLIELLVVIVILGILVAIAVPAYLSFRGKAQTSAAEANVRSAIPAAEAYYQDNGSSYAGLSNAGLVTEAPGIAPVAKLTAGPNAAGNGYCIQDTEDGGSNYAWYTGGTGGTSTITYDATGCPAAGGYTLG